MTIEKTIDTKVDVLLVGSGVMSATLASLLSELDSSLSMMMVERLPMIAAESTDAWNNAGTGHAGYCELNYTRKMPMVALRLTVLWRLTHRLKRHYNFGPIW